MVSQQLPWVACSNATQSFDEDFYFILFSLISNLNLLWCNFRSMYSKRSFGLGVPLFSEAMCKTYEQVGESNQWMPSVPQLRNPHFWGVCALWLNLLCFWLSFSLIWTVTATVHTHQLGSNLPFLPSCLVWRNLQKFSIFERVSSLCEKFDWNRSLSWNIPQSNRGDWKM